MQISTDNRDRFEIAKEISDRFSYYLWDPQVGFFHDHVSDFIGSLMEEVTRETVRLWAEKSLPDPIEDLLLLEVLWDGRKGPVMIAGTKKGLVETGWPSGAGA